jgi:sodium-dependent dicarboxylate transporter 2/3/5
MKELPWGILLLFGGGLSLAAAFQSSGLANWLAERFLFLEGVPAFLILLFLVAAVNFITELTSNVATASVLMPVLASLGSSLGIDSFTLMFACAITASFAFMLPVATAPNAVVFSSGKIPIASMARTGLWLNLVSIALISAYHYFFFPL